MPREFKDIQSKFLHILQEELNHDLETLKSMPSPINFGYEGPININEPAEEQRPTEVDWERREYYSNSAGDDIGEEVPIEEVSVMSGGAIEGGIGSDVQKDSEHIVRSRKKLERQISEIINEEMLTGGDDMSGRLEDLAPVMLRVSPKLTAVRRLGDAILNSNRAIGTEEVQMAIDQLKTFISANLKNEEAGQLLKSIVEKTGMKI